MLYSYFRTIIDQVNRYWYIALAVLVVILNPPTPVKEYGFLILLKVIEKVCPPVIILPIPVTVKTLLLSVQPTVDVRLL